MAQKNTIRVQYSVDISRPLRQMSVLKVAVRNKVLRKAITKASQAMTKLAKRLVPVRKRSDRGLVDDYRGGLLKKSIGYKVKIYRTTGNAVAIVGPRSGFRKAIGITKRSGRPGKLNLDSPKRRKRRDPRPVGTTIYADPVNYAHLVEYGTRHSAAQPFLRPTAKLGAHTLARALHDGVGEAIAKAAAS